VVEPISNQPEVPLLGSSESKEMTPQTISKEACYNFEKDNWVPCREAPEKNIINESSCLRNLQ
jgi:hypothetical protein